MRLKNNLLDWEVASISDLTCCGKFPKPLPCIKLTKNEYCMHAFECLICGRISEVDTHWNAYSRYSGGTNQYGESYKSYSKSLWLCPIEHHPDVKTANDKWSKAFWKNIRKQSRAENIVNGKKRNHRIAELEREDVQIYKQNIVDVRAALGLRNE